jgi:hypothetical protein
MMQIGETLGGGISVSGGMLFAGHGWAWLPSADLTGGLIALGLP